jgi:molybdopterin molybdotransferase
MTALDQAGHRPLVAGRSALVAPSWADARTAAHSAAEAAAGPGSESVALDAAFGRVLVDGVRAVTAMPAFTSSAMDGWAVSGTGPWLRTGTVLAGARSPRALSPGEAVVIATGAEVPAGTTAVLRSEDGVEADGRVHGRVADGADLRPAGEEAAAGDLLVPAGTVLRAAHLGLAAAAGHERLLVARAPRAAVLVLGDELLAAGPARDGRVRDALGPQLPAWIGALGAVHVRTSRVVDDAAQLERSLAGAEAEVVITTGGTAAGPVDHLHRCLAALGARLVVDSVAVRPGHPMLLAELPDGRFVVGLPGNPLAAVVGLLTLAAPLLDGLRGRPLARLGAVALAGDADGPRHGTRLLPCALAPDGAVPRAATGSAMLRGLAASDGLAVLGPGHHAARTVVPWLPLPA